MLKFRTGKFSYNSICTKINQVRKIAKTYVRAEQSAKRESMSGRMEEFGRDCCIRGYHIYKEMWRATIGEELE